MDMRLVLVNVTTFQSCTGARKRFRGRPGTRVTLHAAENTVRRQEPASVDSLARARAATILAERHLVMAIKAAELRFEETAELGREFDRRLERRKSGLRDAGYLAGRATPLRGPSRCRSTRPGSEANPVRSAQGRIPRRIASATAAARSDTPSFS